MPFTFSHPAVLVPFALRYKKKISVTGLAVGSMIPDLEYFIRMEGRSDYGHTPDGIFWFDVPLGILLSFLFHNIVRNQFIVHLPASLQSRLQPELRFNWNGWVTHHWPMFLLCLVVGSASHILWDGFTHLGANLLQAMFVGDVPLEQGAEPLVYYLFFGLNSIAGIWLLGWYTAKLPLYPLTIKKQGRFPYWSVCVMVALAVLLIRLLASDDLSFLGYIDSCISALLIGILTVSVVIRFRRS